MGFWGTLLVCRSPMRLRRQEAEPITDLAWPAWRIWGSLADEAHDAVAAAGSFIAAEIYDSDGAKLTAASEPSGRWTTFLNLDRVVGHQITPPSPFGADGHELTGDALDELNAAYQSEVAEHKRHLLAGHPTGLAAAELASAWAHESGLTAVPVADLRHILDSTELFVEDLYYRLLAGLGLR